MRKIGNAITFKNPLEEIRRIYGISTNYHDTKEEFLQFYLNEFYSASLCTSAINLTGGISDKLCLTGCCSVQSVIKMNLGVYRDIH